MNVPLLMVIIHSKILLTPCLGSTNTDTGEEPPWYARNISASVSHMLLATVTYTSYTFATEKTRRDSVGERLECFYIQRRSIHE